MIQQTSLVLKPQYARISLLILQILGMLFLVLMIRSCSTKIPKLASKQSYIFVIKVYTETVNILFSNINMNFMWIISSKIQKKKNPINKYSKTCALEEQVSISWHMKSNLLPTYCTGQLLTDIFTCPRIYGYCHLTAQCFELFNIHS